MSMTFSIDRRATLAGLAALLSTRASAQDTTSGNVVIYTSNNQQSLQAVTDTARKSLPNLRMNFITGGSGQLLRRMEAEAAKPQADLFWSSSAGTLGAFKSLYEAYKSPQIAGVPVSLREPADLWAATNLHVVTAMVNRNQLGGRATPKTWTDLFDAAYKGKIIIADPANSSTAYTILWGVRQMHGIDGLKKLAANTTVTSAAATVLRSVGQGEYAVGLTFESNAYAYVAGGQREITLVYPEDGTFTSPEFMALSKNAPNGDVAKKAYDALLSRDVQIALLEAAFRRPSRNDIDVSKHAEIPNIGNIKVFALNEDEAAAKRAEFLAEWTAALAAAK
jgi:iron(III) transport system substrate-binding protein